MKYKNQRTNIGMLTRFDFGSLKDKKTRYLTAKGVLLWGHLKNAVDICEYCKEKAITFTLCNFCSPDDKPDKWYCVECIHLGPLFNMCKNCLAYCLECSKKITDCVCNDKTK